MPIIYQYPLSYILYKILTHLIDNLIQRLIKWLDLNNTVQLTSYSLLRKKEPFYQLNDLQKQIS